MRLGIILIAAFIFMNTGEVYSEQEVDKVFLTMEEAIAKALAENNQIRASVYSLKKASWDKAHAWTLLFPTVSFNTRYTKIDQRSYEERDFFRQNIRLFFPDLPGDFEIPQMNFRESYASSIDASIPIFNGAIFNGLAMAAKNKKMAEQLDESTRRQIIFQVISCYLTILKNHELIKTQKEQLELSRLNFEKAERKERAGRLSKADVLQWQVNYQQQKGIVVNHVSILRSELTMLAKLTNIDMKNTIIIDNKIDQKLFAEAEKISSLKDQEILNMIDLSEDSLVNANAALAAAESNKDISKLLYRNSYSACLPVAALSYSHAWRENNTIKLDDYSPKTLMVNVSVPLFTSFQNYSTLKSSYYDYKRSKEDFIDQIKNTRYVLMQIVNNIINLKTQREITGVTLEHAKQNYRVVETQTEKGLKSNLDFIDAKISLQMAELTDINNNYDFISGIVQLYYLLGRLDLILNK
jgi:outer membrane protein